jgi:hypothetical protein
MSYDVPLSPCGSLTAARYEVRLAGGASVGLRTDDLALAMAIAGAVLALGRRPAVRDTLAARDMRARSRLPTDADEAHQEQQRHGGGDTGGAALAGSARTLYMQG